MSIKRMLHWPFALFVVLTMQTVYIKSTNSALFLFLNLAVNLCLLAMVCASRVTLKMMNKIIISSMPVLFIFCVDILYSGITTSSNFIVLLMIFTYGMALIYFANKDNIIKFYTDFVNIITMEAFISLLLYFLIRVANVFEYTNTISILWGGERQLNSWHYLFFDAQSQSYGILIYGRNCGIFPEAPMHALVLVLSLMIQMFKIEKVNRLKLIITVITILSTFSTTGMIVGVVSVLCKYFVDMKRKNRNLGIRQIIFIILLTVGLVMTLKIFEQKLTFAASSVNIRNRNFLYAVKAFLHSPLYGHGFKTNEYAHTSVISQVIADGGVLFFVWYFSSFIRLIYLNWKNKNYADLSFLGCWLLLMSATVITYTNLSICMIATFSCEYRNFKKTIYLDDAHIKS